MDLIRTIGFEYQPSLTLDKKKYREKNEKKNTTSLCQSNLTMDWTGIEATPHV